MNYIYFNGGVLSMEENHSSDMNEQIQDMPPDVSEVQAQTDAPGIPAPAEKTGGEKKPGFFCEGSGCRFGVWRDNRFLTGKQIKLDNKMLSTLLRDGKVFVNGVYSERTRKHFDAYLLLQDDGIRTSFCFAFQREVRA